VLLSAQAWYQCLSRVLYCVVAHGTAWHGGMVERVERVERMIVDAAGRGAGVNMARVQTV
jgi:hypothetical protein